MRVRTFAIAAVLVMAVIGVAAPGASAAGATPKFLTLPFLSTSKMVVQQAWYFPSGYYHHGIDYIHGKIDRVNTWDNFQVVAAADGEACANCFPGVGKTVLIRHRVNGKTWYTYYGHFKWVIPEIPRGSQGHTVHVTRGEVIGTAGASGDPSYLIHLHFELRKANFNVVDPYGIYGTRNRYPNPAGTNGKKSKPRNYWTTNPPKLPPVANAVGGTDGEVLAPDTGGAPSVPTSVPIMGQLPAALPAGLTIFRARVFRRRRRPAR